MWPFKKKKVSALYPLSTRERRFDAGAGGVEDNDPPPSYYPTPTIDPGFSGFNGGDSGGGGASDSGGCDSGGGDSGGGGDAGGGCDGGGGGGE